jgi:acetoin utilization protein AcuB
MNVIDLMTEKPVTIRSDDNLKNAIEAMKRLGVHHLPVVGSNSHVVGIISDRDCRMALNSPFVMRERWQDEELANTLRVGSFMTPAPIVVEPDTPAEEAVRLMLANNIGCLPVMRAETLVGIITRSDVLLGFITLHQHVFNKRGHQTSA